MPYVKVWKLRGKPVLSAMKLTNGGVMTGDSELPSEMTDEEYARFGPDGEGYVYKVRAPRRDTSIMDPPDEGSPAPED